MMLNDTEAGMRCLRPRLIILYPSVSFFTIQLSFALPLTSP
jgi:hypothetical protein